MNNKRNYPLLLGSQFLSAFGDSGMANGEFERPLGIGVNLTNGKIYVADTGNHRIQVFDSTGTFDSTWGTQGQASGQFDRTARTSMSALRST